MRNKIVEMVIFILIISTLVSATNVNVKQNMQATTSEADVPVWKVGDSWVYNEYYYITYTDNGNIWYLYQKNFTSIYTVTDDTGDNYTVKMTSKNNQGWVTIGAFKLQLTPLTKLTQKLYLRKTDLAVAKTFCQEKGLVFWLIGKIGFPIPAQYSDTEESIHTPPVVFMPFPLTAGTNGMLPNVTVTGYEKCSLYWGLIKLYNSSGLRGYTGPLNYACEMENISVPAGTYNSYNVSAEVFYGSGHDYYRSYYVPEVGNYAKQSIGNNLDASGKNFTLYEAELVSTTYKP